MRAAAQEGPLALICGGGSLPLAVADSVIARGREVVLFPLRGAANAAGCRDVVFIGSIVRPALWQIRPDFEVLRILPRIIAAFHGGDDYLLTNIGRLFEEHGFHVLGAHEVAPDILVPEGTLGSRQPSVEDRADIALGLDYLRAAGRFDIGQAVVVAGNHVLAVEAAEGTDQMLVRVAEMRTSGRVRAPAGSGVMVKAPKPGQDRRFDLPSIGPQTIEGVARARLAGIAVVAGSAIIAEPERVVKSTDLAGVFVIGLPAGSEQ